jgi:MFS family permease
MASILYKYKKVELHIRYFIVAEFLIQMINAAFMSILLIYMNKQGYTDAESAKFISYRFLSVLLLAFPFGMYIKGKKMKPFFIISSILTPLTSILIILAIKWHADALLTALLFIWGISFIGIQISALPYIIRNAKPETHTEAISLSFATWSLGGIVSGFLIFGLSKVSPHFFTEDKILILISILGFLSFYFVSKINFQENTISNSTKKWDLTAFDWSKIFQALIPTFIIAIGAGLTIPFISLFFYKIHGVDSNQFALLSAITTIFVFTSVIFVPVIKEKLGYKIAIPLTQFSAIAALIVLAFTEIIPYQWALYLAIACYILRQPLMNLAGPMTSDVIMQFVGDKNRDIYSALTSAIWSGSWFVSSKIFQILRNTQVSYMNIFLITALLYSIGVFAYMRLIKLYETQNSSNISSASS